MSRSGDFHGDNYNNDNRQTDCILDPCTCAQDNKYGRAWAPRMRLFTHTHTYSVTHTHICCHESFFGPETVLSYTAYTSQPGYEAKHVPRSAFMTHSDC